VQFNRLTIQSMVRTFAITAIILLAGSSFTLVSVFAEDQTKTKGREPAGGPIQITANKLLSNAEQKYAEFIGDVKASQENFVITSDSLRIYYEGDLINQSQQPSNKKMIKKIVAKGDVEIISDEYVAKTDQAEYDVATMIVVLTGENSTITSGKNSITGSKITLYRADGRIEVEGTADKRVNALFYSEGKDTDILKGGKSKKEPKE
jgi:lipopolysaccharide export system protein LptA